MTFEVGKVLEDEKWQAPVYCFEKRDAETDLKPDNEVEVGYLEAQIAGFLRGSMQL